MENINTKYIVILKNVKPELKTPLNFHKLIRSILPELQQMFFPALQKNGLKLIFQNKSGKYDFLAASQTNDFGHNSKID